MYVYVSLISNSTSIDYVHDLDQQEVAIDDYLDESDSFEGSVPSFYSMLLKNIILPMMGLPIYPIQFNGLSTHYSLK